MNKRIIIAGKLRVFTSPSAFPNPQRLRLFALEKGIADEFEVINDIPGPRPAQGAALTPTLEFANGIYLAETAGIVQYLHLAYPGRSFSSLLS